MKLWIDYEVAPPSGEWVWAQSLGRAFAEIINMESSVYIGENDSLEEVSIYNNPEDIMGLLYYFSTHNINCPVLIHGEGEDV